MTVQAGLLTNIGFERRFLIQKYAFITIFLSLLKQYLAAFLMEMTRRLEM